MSLVDLEIDAGVATIVLDDAARRNALSPRMVEELVDAVDRADGRHDVGALVLAGRGPVFCAGADLASLQAAADAPDDEASAEVLRQIYTAFVRVSRCIVPTLAAVDGPAVGAGMNLALACDVRVAGPGALFDTRFVELGVHPGGGHSWMLQRIVGPQVAAAMVLLGETADADRSVALGLALPARPDETALESAGHMARAAARAPRDLLVSVKSSLLRAGSATDHACAVELELAPQVLSLRAHHFQVRLAAIRARMQQR